MKKNHIDLPRKSFLVYLSWAIAFYTLSDEQAGRLIKAIFLYVNGDPSYSDFLNDPAVNMAFNFIQDQLDRDDEKYQNIVNRNRENGKNGGRPKKTNKPTGKTGNPKNLDNEDVTDIEDDIDDVDKIQIDFDSFYFHYPKKKSPESARKAWNKVYSALPPIEELIEIIKSWKETPDWKKENGQFIPYPASWLNAHSFKDELPEIPKTDAELMHEEFQLAMSKEEQS